MEKELKVVSISHTAARDGNGRLRYRALAEQKGIDLTLVVPDRWKTYRGEQPADPSLPPLDVRLRPVRLIDFGKAKWYMHYYPRLGELIDELRPDVFHLWEEPWSMVALQALRLCERRSPRPALLLETEQNILRRLPLPFERIRRHTLHHIDALVVRQPEALEVCRACGYEGPGVVVEYCVDRSIFHPNDRTGAKLEFEAEGFTIGYAGRLVPEKGLSTVLEALHLCKQDVQFILLGEGPDEGALRDRVSQLNLERRVRFLPPAPQEKVARLMNSLDAFVLMSRTTRSWKEQFGRVIMEAQACGVPVIGSDSGAIPSVVGKGGWIVKESDAVGLGQLLDRLATRSDELAAAATRGFEQAATRFSPDRVSSDLREAFIRSQRIK